MAACPVAQSAAPQSESSNSKSEPQVGKKENDLRQLLMDFADAINTGNVDKAVAFWSDDASFIDEFGEETHGQSALRTRLERALKQRTESAVELHPEKISSPAPNVALVVGSVSRKSGAADLPATRFSFVVVKQHGTWLINEGTETAIQATTAADHLKELEWLIGKWQAGTSDSPAQLEAEWVSGRNFILVTCTKNNNRVQQIDKQVIGWDPRTHSIVSWHFDCSGGFGYSKWNKQPDGWIVDFAGVGADGSSTEATNVFTVTNPEQFTWKSTRQSADGITVADAEPVTVRRIK
jgi:uncharacterized protein (TIGR02246 family)